MKIKKIAICFVLSGFLIVSCKQAEKQENTEVTDAKEKEQNVEKSVAQIGAEITTLAQGLLLKNVSTQMQKGGPSSAISFCNVKAMPLMDSLSKLHEVEISRVSNKARNANNSFQSVMDSLQYLDFERAEEKHATHFASSPEGDIFYSAIYIGMPTCLKCHGEIGKDIDETTAKTLAELYPNDKATGYKMDDLRGFWKVKFN